MNALFGVRSIYILFAFAFASLVGCAVPRTEPPATLNEVRLGQGRLVTDTTLQPGEVRAEVMELRPARTEIVVRTDDNRSRVLSYDPARTRIVFHGRDYYPQDLQAGDIIAFEPRPRGSIDYVDTIRVQEPVQARAATPVARRLPPPPRPEIIEGTVERIDQERGVFDVRTRGGSIVTAALPYNARPSEVDEFRRLRRGDSVRLEGEYINRDNFQVLAFTR